MENFFNQRKEIKKVGGKSFGGRLPNLDTQNISQKKDIDIEDVDPSLLKEVPPPQDVSESHPKVQLLMDDNRVSRILITCTCGKCMELECNY